MRAYVHKPKAQEQKSDKKVKVKNMISLILYSMYKNKGINKLFEAITSKLNII